MRRIIVDIDNTLRDFVTPFWKKIEHLGVPRPSEWRLDFWKDYLTVEHFPRSGQAGATSRSPATGIHPGVASLNGGFRCMGSPMTTSLEARTSEGTLVHD